MKAGAVPYVQKRVYICTCHSPVMYLEAHSVLQSPFSRRLLDQYSKQCPCGVISPVCTCIQLANHCQPVQALGKISVFPTACLPYVMQEVSCLQLSTLGNICDHLCTVWHTLHVQSCSLHKALWRLVPVGHTVHGNLPDYQLAQKGIPWG
jgi:hypothetical protein